jgi:ADP-ribose pyrophosphatase YjhB (NUDIX family)
MPDFAHSYAGQLRKQVGDMKLIIPAVRAVIRDDQGQVLFIRRSDNGQWNLPAGGIEYDDSVWSCLVREVKEETGLDVISATPIAIYSEPRFSFTNAFGNSHQMFSVVFRVDEWQGELATATDETTDARFFPLDDLPEMPPHHRETLEDLLKFDGRLILK